MSGLSDAVKSGGSPQLLREFTAWSAFSLAFAFISPIVALYSIFSIGLTSIGPGFWWGFPITLTGQALVALVFGILVSRFPLEGSIYQWSRKLLGPTYGWFAGWAYMWTLPVAITAVAVAGAGFVAQALGVNSNNSTVTSSIAFLMIVFATLANTYGRNAVKFVIGLCIFAEIVGSVGLGIVLVLFFQVNHLSVFSEGLFSSGGHFSWSQLMYSVALAGWAFVGFESAASIAEEVRGPQKAVPKAMIVSLLFVASIVAFSAFALTIAMPGMEAVRSGSVADPVASTIEAHLGALGMRIMAAIFSVGFIACMLGLQASVSRVIWAFAREGELPYSRILSELSASDRLPLNAILTVGAMSFVFFALSSTNLYTMLVTFTSAGFYISFLMPAGAACFELLTKGRQQSSFNLGALTSPVIVLATLWLVLQTANICWPRNPTMPWYENWATVLVIVALATLGVGVRLFLPKEK